MDTSSNLGLEGSHSMKAQQNRYCIASSSQNFKKKIIAHDWIFLLHDFLALTFHVYFSLINKIFMYVFFEVVIPR